MTTTNYWIKTENNPHHQASLLAEVIVNNAARYLQVPVPDYALIELGPQQASAIYKRDGQLYESGLCFGSREVSAAQESRSLTYLRRDNHSIHGAGYIALWEWCLGEDEQLLYRTADQFSLVAFDHGF